MTCAWISRFASFQNVWNCSLATIFCTWSCTNPWTDVVIGPARNVSAGASCVRTSVSLPCTSSASNTEVVISRASASCTAGSLASGATTDR